MYISSKGVLNLRFLDTICNAPNENVQTGGVSELRSLNIICYKNCGVFISRVLKLQSVSIQCCKISISCLRPIS